MQINVVEIFQIVIAGVLTAGILALFGIWKQLAKMNGRLIRTETWMVSHEKSDDERMVLIGVRLERIENHLSELPRTTSQQIGIVVQELANTHPELFSGTPHRH